MLFNENKFEVLRYGRNTAIKENTSYSTTHGKIETKSSLRDLGEIVSIEGKFSFHIQNITASAKLSGWILRIFMEESGIRSKLEYCCQLWSSNTVDEIEELEPVQRSFISKISGLSDKKYSLQRRKEQYQIIYTQKILERLVPNTGIKLRQNRPRGRFCYI